MVEQRGGDVRKDKSRGCELEGGGMVSGEKVAAKESEEVMGRGSAVWVEEEDVRECRHAPEGGDGAGRDVKRVEEIEEEVGEVGIGEGCEINVSEEEGVVMCGRKGERGMCVSEEVVVEEQGAGRVAPELSASRIGPISMEGESS